jgi:hypothetical protein
MLLVRRAKMGHNKCAQESEIPQFINIKRYKEDNRSIFHKNESGRSMKIVACVAVILIALMILIICYHYGKQYLDAVNKSK